MYHPLRECSQIGDCKIQNLRKSNVGIGLRHPYCYEKAKSRNTDIRASHTFRSQRTLLPLILFVLTVAYAFAIIVQFESSIKDTKIELTPSPTVLLNNSLSKNPSELFVKIRHESDKNNKVAIVNQASGKGGKVQSEEISKIVGETPLVTTMMHGYHPQVADKVIKDADEIIKDSGLGQNDYTDDKTVVNGIFEKPKRPLEDQSSKNSTEKPLEIHMEFDDPPIFHAPIINSSVKDFDSSINGVVVTKIQGSPHLRALRQMICLFTKAYNNRVNHDIIVFTSEMIEKEEIETLKKIVHPAKLLVEIDNPGLHQMIDDLSPSQRRYLLERCNKNSTSELSWYTECSEEYSYGRIKGERIAYGWQAEFRALWIWAHPALASYKYMMWMDSDVFSTRTWKQDPFAAMERHDLALLFDHFPQGAALGYEFPRRTKEAFGRAICKVSLVNGTLVASDGRCINRPKSRIHQVHGFFHVSSLDFYRSDAVMKWNRALIGDSKFSRLFDDQIGITIPAAVLAGNRSRDMKSLGIYPRVFHNYVLDGRHEDWRGYFVNWWKRNANTTFPEASNQCFVDISG